MKISVFDGVVINTVINTGQVVKTAKKPVSVKLLLEELLTEGILCEFVVGK